MARPGFYNENMNRDYPFIHLQTGALPDDLVADFGCIMGEYSGFISDVHTVYLSAVRTLGSLVEFEFTSDAPGLSGRVLRFVRNMLDTEFTTSYASSVLSSTPSAIDCASECSSSLSSSSFSPDPDPDPDPSSGSSDNPDPSSASSDNPDPDPSSASSNNPDPDPDPSSFSSISDNDTENTEIPGLWFGAKIFKPMTISDPCQPGYAEAHPEFCHEDNPWTGFLVTGRFDSLIAIAECSPGPCNADDLSCELLLNVPVEPSLIQNLTGTYARTLNVANAERTRATTPSECRDYCWPFPLQAHYVSCVCVTGPIRFKEGYNACITQDELENTITINACVGGGLGEPCTQVKITEEEEPPIGRETLDGSLKCDDVIRSINGIGNRFFEILGGTGVVVTSVPEEHKVIVDIDLHTLALCQTFRDQSSVQPLPDDSSASSCDCGPE